MAYVFWLTGLSGAGKSTLAEAFAAQLRLAGRPCLVIDGDLLRKNLCADLGFSPADRRENLRRAASVAALAADEDLCVIVALISPYRTDRAMAKQLIGPERMVEVYLSTPIDCCERRDPKGLYAKARKGEIQDFTGISAPYEIPLSPELCIDTAQFSIEQSVETLWQWLCAHE